MAPEAAEIWAREGTGCCQAGGNSAGGKGKMPLPGGDLMARMGHCVFVR